MLTRRDFVLSSGLALAARRASGQTAPLDEFPYSATQLEPGLWRTQLEETHAVLMNQSEDSLLRPFRLREGLPAPGVEMGGWYDTYAFAPGATYGQWMSALARYVAITQDEATRAKVSRLVRGFAATISPEGKFYRHNRFPSYTYDKLVCGLMDAHEFARDPDALAVLTRATAAAEPYLPPHAIARTLVECDEEGQFGAHCWDESYTLPENLLLAWKRTGTVRYRDLGSRFLFDGEFFDPLARGENVLPGRHAYSHMNALSSAAQAYLSLGSEKHLQAAQNGFAFVRAQSFATGGWGPDELFVNPDSPELAERLERTHNTFETPCGSYAHLKITRYLLRITKDPRYGDSMEQVLYNTVLGAKALENDGRAFYYADYHAGARKGFHADKWPCCSGTLPQVAADYRLGAYFHDPSGVYVNLYLPSMLRWNGVTLTQATNYPLSGDIVLKVGLKSSKSFAIRLRIPEWAGDSARIRVNGRTDGVLATSGSFAAITREWKNGDRIELELPLRLRVAPLDSGHPDLVALQAGPLVLFPLADAQPVLTRGQLLSAAQTHDAGGEWRMEQAKGEALRLRPFFAIRDERYCTYSRLAS